MLEKALGSVLFWEGWRMNGRRTVRVIAGLIGEERSEVLGGDLRDHKVLGAGGDALEGAGLVCEGDGELGREIGVLEGCVADCMEGHTVGEEGGRHDVGCDCEVGGLLERWNWSERWNWNWS
jgi:hypothetical protein